MMPPLPRVTQPEGAARPPVESRPDFRTIFEENARFVWRSLLGLGVGPSDVADASQQVFVVLGKKLDQIARDCSLRTFLYGICLRVASDFRGRAHLRREHLCALPPEAIDSVNPEGLTSHREALVRLQSALDTLEPAQQEVFVLYEIEEMTLAEVAKAVGCPLQTAYSRLRAARKAVSELLGEHLEDL